MSFARWLVMPALGSMSVCLSVALMASLGPAPVEGAAAAAGTDRDTTISIEAAAGRPSSDQPPVGFDRLADRSLDTQVTGPTIGAATAGETGTGSFTDQGGSAPFGVSSVTTLSSSGIPVRAYRAYLQAQGLMATERPSCKVTWSLLAGIGRVESNHGRFGGAGFTAEGRVSPPILGVVLDGHLAGTATVRDTDNGAYDGDATFDRAVGPMQFLPQSWNIHGGDSNGDGQRDPQQIDDAAYGAAHYLCAAGGDLSSHQGQYAAVYRYNHSDSYVRLVLSLAATYASGQPIALPETVPDGAHEGAADAAAAPGGTPPGLVPDPVAPTTTVTDPLSPTTLAPTTVTSVVPETTGTPSTAAGTTATTGSSTSAAGSTTSTTAASTTGTTPSSTTTTAAPTTTRAPTTTTTTAAPTTTRAATTTTTAAPTTTVAPTTTRPSTTSTATTLSTSTSAGNSTTTQSSVAPTGTTAGPSTSTTPIPG